MSEPFLFFEHQDSHLMFIFALRKFPGKTSRDNFVMLYCCKDYKNVTRQEISSEQIFCLLLELWKFLLKYKKNSNIEARKFHFPKYKELYKGDFFFTFLSLESYILKYNKIFRAFISWNTRKFRFLKHK